MTREEAIKEIMSWDFLEEKEIEAIGTLIPEIKDSEDEKFRRYIIKVCEECIDDSDRGLELSMGTTKKLLAYLKKQKEQKAVECGDDIVEEAEEYTSKVACGEYGVEVTEAYIAGVLSERNRGTRLSEKDEKMRDAAIDFVKQNKSFDFILGIDKNSVIDWLKSIRPRKLDASKLENFDPVDVLNRIKTEWPMAWEKAVGKSEWSKEDEETLACAISVFEDFAECKNVSVPPAEAKRYLKQLKSLRPQPKNEWIEEDIKKIRSEEYTKGFNDAAFGGKLKEWSEEDKKMINHSISSVSIENAIKFGNLEYERGVKDGLNHGLNRQWKPSEEQVNALAHFVRSWGESGTMIPQNTILCAAKSLLIDLQKLL